MRRKILILIVLLIFVIITCVIHTNTTNSKSIISEISGNELNQFVKDINEEQKDEKEYIEGEAIVVVDTSPNISTFSLNSERNSIWNDLDIYDEIEIKQENTINNIMGSINTKTKSKTKNIKYLFVRTDKHTTKEIIEELEDEVIHVQPNFIYHYADLTNDPYLKYQWALQNDGQNGGKVGCDINPQTTTSNEEKVIAVIDSGVDYTHEDLVNIMWRNTHSDIQGTYGYDFFDDDTDPMDEFGHGTHCSGIIAAQTNNNKGISGAMLENSNIKIMALKVGGDSELIDTRGALEAYQYISEAQKKGVNVIAVNNSWGGEQTNYLDILLKDWINKVGGQGALSICASGNEGKNIDSIKYSPACIDSDYIITVGASDNSDNMPYFSNYGTTNVDITAPGTAILSAVPSYTFNPSIYTETERNNICKKFQNYDASSTLSNEVDYKVTVGEVTLSDNMYFGNTGKSLKWTINNAKIGDTYEIDLPFKANQNGKYYYSIMGYVNRVWEHLSSEVELSNARGEEDEMYWIPIQVKCTKNGEYTVYIDDYGYTGLNVDKSKFKKYDFNSGTSMATPFVTSAIGTIANKYTNITDALERKQILLNATRTSNSLLTKVSSGRTLDLSKLTSGPETVDLIPTLNLSKNENQPTYIKDTTIQIKNTQPEKIYECNINNSGWRECIGTNIVIPNNEGSYTIQVRAKNQIQAPETYYCMLDVTAPTITVTPEKAETTDEPIQIQIRVSDTGSGVKNTSIRYMFYWTDSLPEGFMNLLGKTAQLEDGIATITYTVEERRWINISFIYTTS